MDRTVCASFSAVLVDPYAVPMKNATFETQDPLMPRLVDFARQNPQFTVADFLEDYEVPASAWGTMSTRVGMMMARIGTHRRVERKVSGVKIRKYEVIVP